MAKGYKTGGRKKGTPNKLTTEVKDAIEAAFERLGGAAYLEEMARKHPPSFMALLGRILPRPAEAGGNQLSAGMRLIVQIVRGEETVTINATPPFQAIEDHQEGA